MRQTALAPAFACILAAAAVLPTGTAAADEAPAQTTVQVLSPSNDGAEGAGTVAVRLAIQAGAGQVPRTASVTIRSFDEETRRRSASLELPPECATACEVSVPVDTTTWHDPGDDPGAPDPMLQETGGRNTQLVTATVTSDTADGEATSTSPEASFVLNNTRPTLWGTSNYTLPVAADDTVPVDLYPSARAGQVLDRVDVALLGQGRRVNSSWPIPVPDAHGNYTMPVRLPVTGLVEGVYTMRAVAFDAAGAASDLLLTSVRVYRAPQVRVEALSAVTPAKGTPNGGVAKIDFTTGPGGWPYAPENLEVFLDGATYQSGVMEPSMITSTDCDAQPCPATTWHTATIPLITHDGAPLSPGRHTVRVRYTESTSRDRYGDTTSSVTTEATRTVTAAGIQAALTVLGPVAEGTGGTLKAVLTGLAADDHARPTVAAWRAAETFPGAPTLASGTCAGATCANLTALVPLKSLRGAYPGTGAIDRRHAVGVRVTDSAGISRTSTITFNVDARARIALLGPSSATYGAKVKLVAGVQQSDNTMLPGVPVAFQARTVGSTTWRTVDTVRTNSLGQAVAYSVVGVNTVWRAVIAQRPGYNGPGASPTRTTSVTARVTLSGIPSTAVAGKAYPVKASVAPGGSGRVVTVQVRSSGSSTWRTVSRPATDRYGVARTSLRLARGTWYVRAVAASTTTSAAGTSMSARTVSR